MELTATKRSITGKGVQALREAGTMPAIVYGAKEEAVAIEVSAKEFGKVFQEAGESDVISLMVDGELKNVLIYDVDMDPITNVPRHADFYAIQKGQKVEVKVPIEFTGESPAVKAGANLVKVLYELEVEADAMHIPHEFTVDVSGMTEIDQEIKAKDIVLPAGVTLVTGPEEVIAIIAEAKEEKEEEVAAAPDMAAIEISEDRGKKPEEEAEAGAKEEKA